MLLLPNHHPPYAGFAHALQGAGVPPFRPLTTLSGLSASRTSVGTPDAVACTIGATSSRGASATSSSGGIATGYAKTAESCQAALSLALLLM